MKDHPCKSCGHWHPLFYRLYSNGHEHLIYACPVSRQQFHVPYVPNLPIPRRKAIKLIKLEQAKKQLTLL